VCLVDFSPQEDLYLCVGTAKDLQLVPRSVTAGFIHVYKLVPVPGSKQLQLQLQHKVGYSPIGMIIHGAGSAYACLSVLSVWCGVVWCGVIVDQGGGCAPGAGCISAQAAGRCWPLPAAL